MSIARLDFWHFDAPILEFPLQVPRINAAVAAISLDDFGLISEAKVLPSQSRIDNSLMETIAMSRYKCVYYKRKTWISYSLSSTENHKKANKFGVPQ